MRAHNKSIISFIGAVLIVVVMLWLSLRSGAQEEIQAVVQTLGYPGMFFGAALSGFNLIAPFPLIALLPLFIASGFTFWGSVIVIALGMTVGDLVGYLLGFTGRKAFSETAFSKKVIEVVGVFEGKYPMLPYFLLFVYVALIPAPNELVVRPMAFVGYTFRSMAVSIVLGNVVFNILAGFVVTGTLSFIL